MTEGRPMGFSELNFNPHPYVRDDIYFALPNRYVANFNPHPYVRDDKNLQM